MSTNPYSPPAASLDDAGIPTGPGVGFKSLTPIAKAITMVMATYVGAELLSDWNTVVAMGVVRRALAEQPYDQSELTAIDVRAQALNVLGYAVSIATVVLFCVFMPRANRNARWFRSPMSITAGWAAGYFFMPIVCLWMPYQAMKEIWQGSDPDPTVQAFTVRVPGLLPWWWGGFVAYGVAARVPQTVNSLIGLGSETFMTRAWVDLGRSLVSIVAIVLAIAVVRAVARRQDQRAVRGPAP
jgi:hypothetical protein